MKNIPLYIKSAASILVFGLLVFLLFVGLNHYSNNAQYHLQLLDLQHQIELDVNKTIISTQKLSPNDNQTKFAFSQDLRGLDNSILELLNKRYNRAFDSISDSSSTASFEFNEEQKILHEANEIWKTLFEIGEKISYKTLSDDSTAFVNEIVELYNEEDSTMKIFTKRVPRKVIIYSKEGKDLIFSFQALLDQFNNEITSLETIYKENLRSAQLSNVLFRDGAIAILLILSILQFLIVRALYHQPLKKIYKTTKSSLKKSKPMQIKYQLQNEIGDIVEVFHHLFTEIHLASKYVLALSGKTNEQLDEQTKKLEEFDTPLSKALMEMKSELLELEEAKIKHNWSFEGQAIFAELISKHTDNFDILAEEVVSQFVKYLNARQGALFVVNTQKNPPVLQMVSCYAFNRKKHFQSDIEAGQGLVGQAWLEEQTVYLTDVPASHPVIKSGLGDAQPNSVLIVPLITHSKVYGVIEITSFKKFEPYEIEFVEKVGETIASTLSVVEINNRTRRLLEESQELTHKMKDQEERMRQNLEELQTTQEEAQRREIQKDREQKILVEKYDSQIVELNEGIENYKAQIEQLNKDVEFASQNSTMIDELKEQIKGLESQNVDFQETIKIKDMRIDKLRKRLQDKKSN